jgi:hypothetical protein
VYTPICCAASEKCLKVNPLATDFSLKKCAGINIFFRIISAKAIIISSGSIEKIFVAKDLYAFACLASSEATCPQMRASRSSPSCFANCDTRR